MLLPELAAVWITPEMLHKTTAENSTVAAIEKLTCLAHGRLLLPLSTLEDHVCRIGATRCDPDHMSCVSRGHGQGEKREAILPFLSANLYPMPQGDLLDGGGYLGDTFAS